MKRSFVVIALVAALCQAAFGLTVSIEPEEPSSDELVHVTAGAMLPTPCYSVASFSSSQTGNDIQMDIYFKPTGDACIQVMTWREGTTDIGPFAPGTYKLNVDAWLMSRAPSGPVRHYGNASITFKVVQAAPVHTLSVKSTPVTGVNIKGEPEAAGGSTDYSVQLRDGAQVSLTAPPVLWSDAGTHYGFRGWRLGNTADIGQSDTTLNLTMTTDKTAVAVYQQEVELRLNTAPWGHAFEAFTLDPEPVRTIPTEDGRIHAMYLKGTEVTVTAKTQIDGLWFDHWTDDYRNTIEPIGSDEQLNLTMDRAQAYTAHYVKKDTVELTLDTDPWGLALDAFALDPEPLRYLPILDGRVHAIYEEGAIVTIHAEERINDRWFEAWLLPDGTGPDDSVGNTITIAMDGSKTLTARYVKTAVLSIDSQPWGLAPKACELAPEPLMILPTDDGNLHAVYPVGTTVTVHVAEEIDGLRFYRWTGPNDWLSDDVSANPLVVVLDRSLSYTVHYVKQATVELTLDTDPWGLALDAFALDPEPLRYLPILDGRVHAIYEKGTTVTVRAEQQIDDYWFHHWSGPGDTPDNPGIPNRITTVMDADKSYIAHYIEIDAVELTLDTDPYGNALTAFELDPEPVCYLPIKDGRVHAIYDRNTEVTILADEYIDELWFDHWTISGIYSILPITDNPLTWTIDADRTFTAHYVKKDTVELLLDTAPWGHALDVFSLYPEPLRILPVRDGRLHAIYERGTEVTINTMLNTGDLWFDYWKSSEGLPIEDPRNTRLQVTMDKPKGYTAHYVSIDAVELTLDTHPWGYAIDALSVEPEPFRYIHLRDARIHAIYERNTQVTVHAKENIDGMTFDHWTISGIETFAPMEDNPLTFVVDADKTCKAHYVEDDTVQMTLDSRPWGLALSAYTLSPEPLRILPTDDGRLHAIYDRGAEVSILAHDGNGYRFDHWETPLTPGGPTANPLELTLKYDCTWIGCFVETVEVLVSTVPSGLEVKVDDAPHTAPYQFTSDRGASHEVGVESPQTGDIGEKHVFTHWSDGGEQFHQITAEPRSDGDPMTLFAHFRTYYRLNVHIQPRVLAGECTIGGTAGDDQWYPEGTDVELEVSPCNGWRFRSWAGDIQALTDTEAASTSVNMVSNTELTAVLTNAGDIDGDGCVNVADLLLVRGNLGKTDSDMRPPQTDVNGDNTVNVADMIFIRNSLGEGHNCPD